MVTLPYIRLGIIANAVAPKDSQPQTYVNRQCKCTTLSAQNRQKHKL